MLLSHTPTVDAIQASASRHAELVRGINELDYSKPALEQCSAYLRDLKGQKDMSIAALGRLAKSTEKERTEHIELKKSITRKWSSKLVGRGEKFQKRVTKEEKEYIEALENEHEARVKHEKLLADIEEAENNNRGLKEACDKREYLQAQLDALYERVFSGSNPDFPQEDEYEDRVSAAEAANYQAQSDLTYESQTLSVLSEADRALSACLRFMQSAKDYSTWDVWGGGIMADFQEGDMLMSAQSSASQFASHLAQAKRMNGRVRDVAIPVTPRQSTMDVYFDNVFSDLAMHDKIKAGLASVDRSRRDFNRVFQEAQQRAQNAEAQAVMTSSALAAARHALHDLRAAMFTNVLNGGGTSPLPDPQEGGAPPPFSEGAPAHNRSPPPPGFSATTQISYSAPPGPPPGHPPTTGSGPVWPQVLPAGSPPGFSPDFSSGAPQHAPPPGPPPQFMGPLSISASRQHPPPGFPTPSPAATAASSAQFTSTARPGLSSNNPYAALLAAGRK